MKRWLACRIGLIPRVVISVMLTATMREGAPDETAMRGGAAARSGVWPNGLAQGSPTSWCAPDVVGVGVHLFCSSEVDSSGPGQYVAVDGLDDLWRARVQASSVVVGRILSATLPVVLRTDDGFTVTAELRDVDDEMLRQNADYMGTVAQKPGFADGAGTPSMQDDAPKPGCPALMDDPFWNETSGSTISSSRNAVLFRFSEPVSAFGAWFGDLETRDDGHGVTALIRLFDRGGHAYSDSSVLTSTPKASQGSCRSSGSGPAGCGNRTTRWIGFVSDEPDELVTAILVVVGDGDGSRNRDDDPPNKAEHEHISFIGPSVAWSRAVAPKPEPTSVTVSARVFLPIVRCGACPVDGRVARTAAGACD